MPTLTALVLATPLFGLSLTPPAYAAPAIGPAPSLQIQEAAEPTQEAAEAAQDAGDARLASQLATRRTMADWMTGIGIAAIFSMATTAVLGAIHFHDQYGFHDEYADTPCGQQRAIMQEYCGTGTVVPHAIAAGTTTALYVTAASLGIFMPDPLGASEQPGPYGDRIRLHSTLRWVTTTLLIVQSLLGTFVSHADWFGLDFRNDFDALHGLAITHMGIGLAALTSLTIQGSVMLF